MRIDNNKNYLVVIKNSDGFGGDTLDIISGRVVQTWLSEGALKNDDELYELGQGYICKVTTKRYFEKILK